MATLNPADVFSPLVKILAGSDIDINNLLPEDVPDYWEQVYLVAQNPGVAAKFFNIYMKAFISAILVLSSQHHPCSMHGINPDTDDADHEISHQIDLHLLVSQCHSHMHSGPCYKY